MKALMLLCDFAAVAEGKLYVSGGGWSVTGPAPTPSALALKIDVPWHQANDRIAVKIELQGEDGHKVDVPGPLGPQPVELGVEFEVGRPPGLVHGTSIDVPLALPIAPLPLAPGSRFTWVLSINGETREEWQVAFQTRDLPPPETVEYVVDPPQ